MNDNRQVSKSWIETGNNEAEIFLISTFGCRAHQADSAALLLPLCEAGCYEVRDEDDAELIVGNSCTITRRSDQQARQDIRSIKRRKPAARIVMTGG